MSVVFAVALLLASENPLFRKPPAKVAMESDEIRRLSVHFGDCVVERERDLARTFVLRRIYTAGDAVEHIKMAKKLSIGNCLLRSSDSSNEVGMRFPGDTMRYVLADALFKREFASRPPLSNLEQVPDLAQGASINEFGECIVRRDPGGAYTLLRSPVLAPAENHAFVALKPAMADCLTAGSTVALNKIVIRGAVALNYILLANAPRTAAPGSESK